MKTVNHKFEFFLCILRALESLWQKINQKQQFMQNKANLLDTQMNVSSVLTKHYENERLCGRRENKAKTNPNKPNFRKAKMKLSFYSTKDYEYE